MIDIAQKQSIGSWNSFLLFEEKSPIYKKRLIFRSNGVQKLRSFRDKLESESWEKNNRGRAPRSKCEQCGPKSRRRIHEGAVVERYVSSSRAPRSTRSHPGLATITLTSECFKHPDSRDVDLNARRLVATAPPASLSFQHPFWTAWREILPSRLSPRPLRNRCPR